MYMKTLLEYLHPYKREPFWDGHIHLFNSTKTLPEYDFGEVGMKVGFMDLEYDKKNLQVVKSYERFIENDYKENTILLATGTTIEDIKTIYEKYPSFIKGFGELKCYDEYHGVKVPYKKIAFVRQVCRYSMNNGSLPVYLHWEICNEKDVQKISKLLRDYPTVPVVLCHCGMNATNQSYAYTQVCQLMKQYQNLWIDISYDAMKYLGNYIMLLDGLDRDRVILGSDINIKLFGKSHDPEVEITQIRLKLDIIEGYLGRDKNEANIRKLFNIKSSK